MKNLDEETVNSFGDEWARFDQSALSEEESNKIFQEYIAVFPWDSLSEGATGFDMGCGSGRWARLMAPRVGHLHCFDSSPTLEVEQSALSFTTNVFFIPPFCDDGLLSSNCHDYGYSLLSVSL